MYETGKGFKFAEEDLYNDGCQPHTAFDVEYDAKFEARTLDELLKQLCDHFDVDMDDIQIDACDEAGRIDVQRMENGDSDKPSDAELFKWKRGEVKLWAATYTFNVTVVDRKVVKLRSQQQLDGIDR